MSPEEHQAESEHRSFMLTAERRLSRRHRIARGAIVIYFVAFLAACLVMCSCPGFFAVMTVCALVSFFYGSRLQRLLSVVLLPVAIVGFFIQLQQEHSIAERAYRVRQLQQQRPHEQQPPKQ